MVKINRKTKIGLIVLALLGIGILVFGSQQYATYTGEMFVKPSWARLECAPTDTYEGVANYHVSEAGVGVECGKSENTAECNYYLKATKNTWWSGSVRVYHKICNLDGTNCDSYQVTSISEGVSLSPLIRTVPEGKELFVKCKKGLGDLLSAQCDVQKQYKPWKLYRFVGGAKFEAKATNCYVGSENNANIPAKEQYPNPLTKTGGIGSKWINYVDDWYFGPATNVFPYEGKNVYCTAGQIFEIATLEMKDGSFKKIDPSYQGASGKPDYVKSIGSLIKGVECCPNEPYCGADFKFHREEQKKACFSDVQCYNAGAPVPITATQYVKYQCVSGACAKSEPITVECTNSAQCKSGEVCDMTLANYGKCTRQTGGTFCGDGNCDRDESVRTCVADCGAGACGANDIKIGTTCLPSWVLIMLIVGIVLIMVVVSVIVVIKKSGRR